MSVHSATPYYCRWVFETIAIVGTVAPANRRLFFQKRWLQLKFVRGFRAFARKIFNATRAHDGVSLLQMKASRPVCLVNIAMTRRSERLRARRATHANVKLLVRSLAGDVRSSGVPL